MKSFFILTFLLIMDEYVTQKGQKIYKKILNFDLGIYHNLTHLTNDGGEQMVRDIESFTDLLWELRDKVKARNKTVIQGIQPFMEQKTPVFLSFPIDEEKVKKAFKWDKEDLDVLFHVSKHSQVLWDEMKYWFNKTVAGNVTYWLQ